MWGFSRPDSQEAREAFAQICKDTGLGDLLESPYIAQHGSRLVGLGRDAQELKPVFEDKFADMSSQELVVLINSKGGIAAPLQDYEALFNHEQFATSEILQEVEHPVAGKVKVVGPVWKFSNMSVRVQGPPPLLGQHTAEILCELGYGKREILELEALGGIFCGRIAD